MFKDSLCFHALAMAMSKLCMGATFALTTGSISMALKERKKVINFNGSGLMSMLM
jgi:hypothetical protein